MRILKISPYKLSNIQLVSSVAQSCLTLCDPHGLQQARPPCPSPTPRVYSNSCPLSRWCHPTISSSFIPFHPLLLLPSIFPSIRAFSNESALRIRWPKYCSFSFSISPSNEYLGLISFRMDWLDTVLLTLSGRVGRDWRDLAHTHMRVPLLIPRATLTLSPHPQKKSNTMYQRNPRGLEHRAWCFLDHQGNSHPGWVLVVRRKLRCSRITTDQKWGGPASSSCSAPN